MLLLGDGRFLKSEVPLYAETRPFVRTGSWMGPPLGKSAPGGLAFHHERGTPVFPSARRRTLLDFLYSSAFGSPQTNLHAATSPLTLFSAILYMVQGYLVNKKTLPS